MCIYLNELLLHPSEVCFVAWSKPDPIAAASGGAFDSVLWVRFSSGVSCAGLCPVTHWTSVGSARPLLVSPLFSSFRVILPRDSQLCAAGFSGHSLISMFQFLSLRHRPLEASHFVLHLDLIRSMEFRVKMLRQAISQAL